jgi:hypothetical protein
VDGSLRQHVLRDGPTCFLSASDVLITVNRQLSSLVLIETDVSLIQKKEQPLGLSLF